LPEPRRTDVGDPVRAAEALRQLEQQAQRLAPLLVVGASRVGDEARRRDSTRALDFCDDAGEARQTCSRGRRRSREKRPVTRELLQVQVARREPLLPVSDRRSRHTEAPRDRRHRRARALTRLDDRERQLDRRRLSGQHVQRVHSLAVLARTADGLPDSPQRRRAALQPTQPALDPASRQPERLAPALRATTAREHFLARSLQHLPIGGTVDLRQYVDHVLLDGPGIRSRSPGAVFSVPRLLVVGRRAARPDRAVRTRTGCGSQSARPTTMAAFPASRATTTGRTGRRRVIVRGDGWSRRGGRA
jgi:hypothetical protein